MLHIHEMWLSKKSPQRGAASTFERYFGGFWSSGGTPGALWVQTGTGVPFFHEFRVDLDLILETLADPWASLCPPCAVLLLPLPRFFDVFLATSVADPIFPSF